MKSIKNARLNSVLQDNELRRYLAGKAETAKERPEAKPAEFRRYGTPFDRAPRVLLIGPPLSIPRHMQKRCIPPLGLCYIAAMLEREGCAVMLVDCCVEGYETERVADSILTYGLLPCQFVKRIGSFAPDVIGISVLFSSDLPNVMKVALEIKKACPATPIVLGGLHPTIYPEAVFSLAKAVGNGIPCIDWILRGEGEYRFANFIRNLQRGEVNVHADGLAGLIEGKLVCNPQYGTIGNLDDLPFPAYHLLPMERYFEINVPFSPVPRGDRVLQILTSRGCPIGCSFCASTNLYKQYRVRSVENVIREIKYWRDRLSIDEIQFADDNLTLLAERTRNLVAALKHIGLPWCTPNGTMVNTLDSALLADMREAGLYQITLSIDSGSAKTLREYHHKPVELRRVPELIATCGRLGVWTHGTLVVGMPGETLQDIQEGFDYVMDHLPFTSISTFIAQPIPGSELYHSALEAELISPEDAQRIDSTQCKFRFSSVPPDQLERLAAEFQQRFTDRAQARDPGTYQAKYGKLIRRGLLKETARGRLA